MLKSARGPERSSEEDRSLSHQQIDHPAPPLGVLSKDEESLLLRGLFAEHESLPIGPPGGRLGLQKLGTPPSLQMQGC